MAPSLFLFIHPNVNCSDTAKARGAEMVRWERVELGYFQAYGRYRPQTCTRLANGSVFKAATGSCVRSIVICSHTCPQPGACPVPMNGCGPRPTRFPTFLNPLASFPNLTLLSPGKGCVSRFRMIILVTLAALYLATLAMAKRQPTNASFPDRFFTQLVKRVVDCQGGFVCDLGTCYRGDDGFVWCYSV